MNYKKKKALFLRKTDDLPCSYHTKFAHMLTVQSLSHSDIPAEYNVGLFVEHNGEFILIYYWVIQILFLMTSFFFCYIYIYT